MQDNEIRAELDAVTKAEGLTWKSEKGEIYFFKDHQFVAWQLSPIKQIRPAQYSAAIHSLKTSHPKCTKFSHRTKKAR